VTSSYVEAEAGWSALAEQASYSYYRPLSYATQEFIAEAQSDQRIHIGIAPIDAEMRGISAGHLAMIVGYSHSGKTLVAMHAVRHNATKRVLWYSPDEPAVLVLTKLASATWGISAEELEARVRHGDPSGIRILHETEEAFSTVAIIDRPLTPRTMRSAYEEVCSVWGDGPELVVVDYLDLLQVGEHSTTKAEHVKAFCTEHEVPMIVLHQTSRSAGSKGQRMSIDSGNYGGETVSTYQIGVRRKRSALLAELNELEAKPYKNDWTQDRMADLRHQLDVHAYTVTVNLVKNKRPGGSLTNEIDLELQLDTGVLSPLNGDLPTQLRRLRVVPDAYTNYDNGEVTW